MVGPSNSNPFIDWFQKNVRSVSRLDIVSVEYYSGNRVSLEYDVSGIQCQQNSEVLKCSVSVYVVLADYSISSINILSVSSIEWC